HLDAILTAPKTLRPTKHHPSVPYPAAPALFARLTAADATIPEQCLAFAVLCASRSVEARGVKKSEFDLTKKIWTVPPERMKLKREHVVPLPRQALALIERLWHRDGEYLFAVAGRDKPIVAQSLRTVLRRHAGPGYTVHGCRATFRTWSDEETEGFER